jgi:hypothetical protein
MNPVENSFGSSKIGQKSARDGFGLIIVLIAVAALGVLVFGGWYARQSGLLLQPKACTQEAKLCPDGTAVGRTGADCEFAKCPEVVTATSTADTSNWKTYRNDKYGFEFKYSKDATVTAQDNGNGFKINVKQGQSTLYIMANLSQGKSLDEITSDYRSTTLRAIRQGVIGERKIGGERAVEIAEFGGSATDVYSLRLVRNGYAYLIWGYATAAWDRERGNYEQQNVNFNQILSTFKFIAPSSTGKFCGGIAGLPCDAGYACKLDGAYPDAGGQCVLPDGTGTLRGQVTVGPICPVESIPPRPECMPTPEMYASRQFLVKKNGQTVTSFYADMSGNYSISLMSGTYTVVSTKTGIGYMSKDLPGTVTIQAGKTATLNISVDTGIR